jgi:sterol desaturase/sphingolipid hydroxylase (fatty acid hydroxylase superfamily)
MNTIFNFFNQNHQNIQSGIFVAVFLACWFLEYYVSDSSFFPKKKHVLNNFLFSLSGAVIQVLVSVVFLKIILFENANNIGLIPYLNFKSGYLNILFAFIFLDFTYWLYHFLMHKIPVLWRFHSVHHSDSHLNVSTSLREHPFETMIRLGHYVLAVSFLGPALWIISLHQFIQIISKIIIHADLRLPEKTDRILSFLVLTPNMHQVHHHYVRPYTDSNYGDLFSIWDRMFKTFYTLKKEELKFGLDQYPESVQQPEAWYKMLVRPFINANYK